MNFILLITDYPGAGRYLADERPLNWQTTYSFSFPMSGLTVGNAMKQEGRITAFRIRLKDKDWLLQTSNDPLGDLLFSPAVPIPWRTFVGHPDPTWLVERGRGLRGTAGDVTAWRVCPGFDDLTTLGKLCEEGDLTSDMSPY